MTSRILPPAERLIVAADFAPEPDAASVRHKVLELARELEGTGVYLKVESALRMCGYKLITQIHGFGLKVFADLKLSGILQTLKIDGLILNEYKPELVTVMCSSHVVAMRALRDNLPGTEVLGISVLTGFGNVESGEMFACTVAEGVERFVGFAKEAELGGVICAPAEVQMLREKFGVALSLNTPNIRPKWSIVKNDDQNAKRAMTIGEAIKASADRIVIGRPILHANNRHKAVMRSIDEIAQAVE